VIHRAPLGSHERFIAFLLEHYAGAFPVWLAPVQAIVIPIADRHNDYGNRVLTALRDADVPTAMGGMRAEIDDARESMQKKIRNAQNRKIPYMLVVGDREEEENTVAVRFRGGQQSQTMPLSEFIERVRTEVKTRTDSPA
jgi:threonyl-tRNA synthetase